MCFPPVSWGLSPGRCRGCGSPASGEEGSPSKATGRFRLREAGTGSQGAPSTPAGQPAKPSTTRRHGCGCGHRGQLPLLLQATPTQTGPGNRRSQQRTPRRPRAACCPGSRVPRFAWESRLPTHSPVHATFLHRGSRVHSSRRHSCRHAQARAHRPTGRCAHARTRNGQSLGRPLAATSRSTRPPGVLPAPLQPGVDLGDLLGWGRRWDWTLNVPCLQSSCYPVICMNKTIFFPKHSYTMLIRDYRIT